MLSFGPAGVDQRLLEALGLLGGLELKLYLLLAGGLFSLLIEMGKPHYCQLDAVFSVHEFLHIGGRQKAGSVDHYFGYLTLQSQIRHLQVAFRDPFQEEKHVFSDRAHPSLEFHELELPQPFTCAFEAQLLGLLIWLILSCLLFFVSLHLFIFCFCFRRNNGKRGLVLQQPAQVQRCLTEGEKVYGLLILEDVDSRRRRRETVWLDDAVLLLYDRLLINMKQNLTFLDLFGLCLSEQLILLIRTKVCLLELFALPLRFFLHMPRTTSAEAWRSRMHGNY